MKELEYDYIEEINHFLEVIKSLQSDYEEFKEKERELAKIKKDIRHIYELCELDTVDMINLSEVYRDKLRERREVIKNKRMLNRINHLFKKKYSNFIEEMSYVIEKVDDDFNRDKSYYAKSRFGQLLIDKYSDYRDDLVCSPSESDLEDLKSLENKFNVSS